MSYTIIDAHVHLWNELKGNINGQLVKSLGEGKALFQGEVRQMMPAYMIDGKNTYEMLIANMNYSGVAGAVLTQEFIDGDQNQYLLEAKKKNPHRLKICGLAEFRKPGFFEKIKDLINQGVDGIKIPAQWLMSLESPVELTNHEMIEMFKYMEKKEVFLSIDLAEGDQQVGAMEEIIQECPNLKIAIGHFGMANRPGWKKQILLARYKNVRIESGGITWLYHKEFYPYDGAVQSVLEAIQMVGIDKLMWGSDYPRTMTAITYTMSYDFFIKTKELTSEEKAKLLGLNACVFYGFKDLSPMMPIRNMVED